jgi:glutathione peroxidase
MKKNVLMILFFLLITSVTELAQSKNFYSFKVKTLEGKDFELRSLKGEKIMVVNTASLCGNTPQYKDLEDVYQFGIQYTVTDY